MKRRNILRLFESRRGHLEYRAKRDYVRNGIASIPCRIFSFTDVISPYSVKPPDCPLVLNIIGNCLSPDEKKTIEKIVRDDFSYDLGLAEIQEHRHTRIFAFMFLGLVLSGILLWLTETLAEEPREVFFILFWFMGESLCDYIFLTGHDLRRVQASRLFFRRPTRILITPKAKWKSCTPKLKKM